MIILYRDEHDVNSNFNEDFCAEQLVFGVLGHRGGGAARGRGGFGIGHDGGLVVVPAGDLAGRGGDESVAQFGRV